MPTRKDMKGVSKDSNPSFFFRAVVKNGGSKSLNLTDFLQDWEQVRISVIEESDNEITLKIENTGVLKI